MAGTVVADAWKNGDGTENYKCRAWVNFNGTGTVAIRASGNVSSITDNGTGNFTVNFGNAMPDANYSAGFVCTPIQATGSVHTGTVVSMTGSAFRFTSMDASATPAAADWSFNGITIFR
jgi:hypothetical protein